MIFTDEQLELVYKLLGSFDVSIERRVAVDLVLRFGNSKHGEADSHYTEHVMHGIAHSKQAAHGLSRKDRETGQPHIASAAVRFLLAAISICKKEDWPND
jgi:hypothetical protein